MRIRVRLLFEAMNDIYILCDACCFGGGEG